MRRPDAPSFPGLSVPTRVGVVRQPLAHLQDREHPAHLDRPVGTRAGHHRQGVFRPRHVLGVDGMFGHPRGPHRHVAVDQPRHPRADLVEVGADRIRKLVAHGVHGVMALVAVERPVAGRVGHELDGARLAGHDRDRRLRDPGRSRDLATVALDDPEAVAVNVQRVARHAQVRAADADAVVLGDDQRCRPGIRPAVEREEIEVEHDVRVGAVRARVDRPHVREDAEVAIERLGASRPRVGDEEPHHAQGHLRRLVRVGVVHERAVLPHAELVDVGLAGRDVGLEQSADAVHPVRQEDAVPVDGRVFRQPVRDVDADVVALDDLDRRAGSAAVVAPGLDRHARGELLERLVRDDVELLPGAVAPPARADPVEVVTGV